MPGRFEATTVGRSLGDHMCLPYRGTGELVSIAGGYVQEGLDRHERVTFCTIHPTGMRYATISAVTQVGRPAGKDLPVLATMTTDPGWEPSTSPIAVFGRMTDAALADGYAGLRVLTDATDIVLDPDTRPWWVRGEHLIDRYGLDHPLAIVCSYDADLVGEEILAGVACMHAMTGETPCSFLLRAIPGGLALVGEVDRGSAVELYHAVMGIGPDLPRPVVLDLSEHEFIDHSALVALERAARALGTQIELVGASALTGCLVDVLHLSGLTVREEAP